MTGVLITLQAFTYGERVYFRVGVWSRWENRLRFRGAWEAVGPVETPGPQSLSAGPTGFWGRVAGHATVSGPRVSKPQTGRGVNASSQHMGLCPLGLHLHRGQVTWRWADTGAGDISISPVFSKISVISALLWPY